MIRLLFFGLAIYVVMRLIKGRLFSGRSNPKETGGEQDGNTDLYRDPQCGAYFLRNRGVKAVVDGRTIYFCSPQCRDDYLRRGDEQG